jgi:hypothetical protein
MNIRRSPGGIPLIALALAASALAAVSLAQLPDTPPMKMGLWQTEVSTTMSGMENSPMAHAGANRTNVTQACMTPETWKKDLEDFHNHQKESDCTVSNQHMDPHGITFDETCASNAYSTKIHFEAQFDADDHMHGTGKIELSGSSFPQTMIMNMTMTSKYLGSSCGDVQPGHAKTIRQ